MSKEPCKTAENQTPSFGKTTGFKDAKAVKQMNTTDLATVEDFDVEQFMTELEDTTEWLEDLEGDH